MESSFIKYSKERSTAQEEIFFCKSEKFLANLI